MLPSEIRWFWEHMRPRVVGFRCRILDNGLFILNLSGSCGSVMTHLSPTGEWFTHSSLLSHKNSLRETWEGAKYISLLKMATIFMILIFKCNWLLFIINAQFMIPPPVWVLCNFIKILDLERSNKKNRLTLKRNF